jgi:hypothetical protein
MFDDKTFGRRYRSDEDEKQVDEERVAGSLTWIKSRQRARAVARKFIETFHRMTTRKAQRDADRD